MCRLPIVIAMCWVLCTIVLHILCHVMLCSPGALWKYLLAADTALSCPQRWLHPLSHCQDAYGEVFNHQFTSLFLISSSLSLWALILAFTLAGIQRQSPTTHTLILVSTVLTLRWVRLESVSKREIRTRWTLTKLKHNNWDNYILVRHCLGGFYMI